MPEPFFERLRAYYASVATVLRTGANASAIFPNAGDIGSSRERIYVEMLKQHIPSSCNVLRGGFLFGLDGTESKQIDILVIDAYSMQYNFPASGESPKSFACVDGCIAIVSVKSTLDSAQLTDSLLNIASIPDKRPLTQNRVPSHLQITRFNDWPYKVVYASDGMELQTTLDSVGSFYDSHPQIPNNKRPNIIHVMGKHNIIRIPEQGLRTRNGIGLEPNSFYGTVDIDGVLGLMWTISEIQAIASASKIVNTNYGEIINKIRFVI